MRELPARELPIGRRGLVTGATAADLVTAAGAGAAPAARATEPIARNWFHDIQQRAPRVRFGAPRPQHDRGRRRDDPPQPPRVTHPSVFGAAKRQEYGLLGPVRLVPYARGTPRL